MCREFRFVNHVFMLDKIDFVKLIMTDEYEKLKLGIFFCDFVISQRKETGAQFEAANLLWINKVCIEYV